VEDAGGLLLSEAVPSAYLLNRGEQTCAASQVRKIQAAKDFESVLITKLLDEMKRTIVDWGLEKDDVSKQVYDIFWLYLARGIADEGGFGLWKEIYRSLSRSDQSDTKVELFG